MAQFTWAIGGSGSVPTGVLKNHKLSQKIREASIVNTQFAQLARPEPGYGKKMGENITITRIANITVPTTTVLTEGVRIPEDQITMSTQAITVAENGRAVPFTSIAKDLLFFDLENPVQKALMKQLKVSLDNDAATAAKSGQIVAIPEAAGTLTFETDGDATATAAVNLNLFHVEQMRDYAFTTLNLDFHTGDSYLCVADTTALRGLKRDANWKAWQQPISREAMFNSEVGKIESIRFIESNNRTALSGTKGTGSVLGEAVLLGDDALVSVIAEDPHLRMKKPEDFDRSQGVAWYGIYAYGQIWNDSGNAGQARSIYVTSA